MTNQEMFETAYKGLASQGFKRAFAEGVCQYTMHDAEGKVMHCAWGWVDTSIQFGTTGAVHHLHEDQLGLAATLDDETLKFARDLQIAHDGNMRFSWGVPARETASLSHEDNMKANLADVAEYYKLHIPQL